MSVNYWERHDGKIIDPQEGKYQLHSREIGKYSISSHVNITLDNAMDFGLYYCISKNEKGLTKAGITLFGENL